MLLQYVYYILLQYVTICYCSMLLYIAMLYIIVIIIIKIESAMQGRETVRTFYQSEDLNPTQPTHGKKENKK